MVDGAPVSNGDEDDTIDGCSDGSLVGSAEGSVEGTFVIVGIDVDGTPVNPTMNGLRLRFEGLSVGEYVGCSEGSSLGSTEG
jgi:hypothetical protein